jgi:adenylate cyclase class IV
LGIRDAVEKERIAVVSEDTRVHLDRVEGLGQFAEIEILVAEGQPATAARQRARELMIVFELDAADIVSQSYIDLLEAGSV